MKNRKWTKTALAISACLFILWWVLGTSATLAWFTDTTSVARNEFRIGKMNLDVSFKNDVVKEYTALEGSTEVFNDQALYEPGYTQVVYFKIENNGDVNFNYKMAVTVNKVTTSMSVLGNEIYLPNYLRYGVVFAKSEDALKSEVASRLQSRTHTDTYMLDTWSKISEYTFAVGEDPHYAALIIYMPTEVTNVANYRGTPPKVELGVAVYAQQAGT